MGSSESFQIDHEALANLFIPHVWPRLLPRGPRSMFNTNAEQKGVHSVSGCRRQTFSRPVRDEIGRQTGRTP